VAKNQLRKDAKLHLTSIAMDCGRKISFYVSARYQDIKLLSRTDVFEGNDTEAKQKYIEEIVELYPFCDAISVIDLKGRIIACTRKELVGQSRADEVWFQRTIQSKEGGITALDTYRAQTAGDKMVIGFNLSIIDEENQEVVGVLTTRVSMNHIVDRIRALDERIPGDNHAYLLNRRGEILAGPDENEFLNIHRLHEFPVVRDLLAGKTGITEYENDRGEDVISAGYALVGDGSFDGWGWGIIVTEPLSEAFKAAYAIRNIMIVLVLAVTLLITVFAVSISRRFSRPIIQVSKSALRIARGDLKPTEIKYGPKDEIGNLVGAFNKMMQNLRITTISRDSLAKEITERQRAEQKLQETQEQLIRREKLAVLGQMAGSVGHELRNPLGVISNAAYYLKMTLSETDEITREYLEIISSEVSNSEKIISDLLNLSRTKPAEREKVNVPELISQVLEKQPILQGIEVRREISPHLPYLYVDPRQIEEVLINLIINAYQAMPQGGVLTIKAQEKEDKVLILITDTGVGISKENLSKLFEPLFTTKARGIGLGLCVSRNLTEVNGGEIKVKSKEGEGTTFTLILPTGEVS